jgi:hypothetical protein
MAQAAAQQPSLAAEGRIDELIALTERLTALIAEQAQAFETRRPQDAARNMEETTRLANIYRREAQVMRAQPRLVAAASKQDRQKLIRATEAFDAVIARQGRALNAAKTITEGLVHAIATEICKQRTANTGYGPAGVKPKSNAVTAVTLNRRA